MPPAERRTAPRIAVTGYGAVSGYGVGAATLWRGLASGQSAIRPVERFDVARYRTKFAAEVPEPPGAGWSRRLSLADRFALAATEEALAQSGQPARFDGADAPFAGLYFGSSTGGMLESETIFAGLLAHPEAAAGSRRLAQLAAQPTSGPAEAVARAFRLAGPVETIASACASATLAFGNALDALRSGEVEVALVGGSDSFCRLTFAGFNSLRAVDALPCRPFRAEREGMTIGEGAAVLVLEPEERARRRGAEILGYVRGAGASCDAHHMTAPDPSGAGIRRAVTAALVDAGVDRDEIDFVNAHGTGTPHNDEAEAAMLRAIFGARLATVPVTSSKGALGHLLGSAGAIEALATLLCLAQRRIHPTPGGGSADPRFGVDLVVGSCRAADDARFALSTNLAFGGANAAVVLERA
ncbi:MAG: beta-ketoacyl-[acyl-carrier-protein] synthase family protein [Thermoanaerobaculia bacterium]